MIAELQTDLALARKRLKETTSRRARYEKLIQETEQAYSKIVESSQTLLDILHQETESLAE
eukprot:jgi/Hompol1/5790/HPOL_004693-RA